MTLLTANSIGLSVAGQRLLDNISVAVDTGEVVAIIGPNGAGKTSLMKVLSGDITPTVGKVLLADTAIDAYEVQARACQLAVLSQQNILEFAFLAEDVVRMGRIPHSSGNVADEQIVQQALAAMDISYLAKRSYPQLSGGEKQRVQLARVMAQLWRNEDAPQRVLMLDEPTAALDVAHTQQLMQVIRQFADSGAAVVMIVHDFNVAARYADRIVALSCGKLVAQGAPSEVLSTANMRDIFGVSATIMSHPKTAHPVVFIDD